MSVQAGSEMLADAGLLMQAALSVAELPEWLAAPLQGVGVDLDRYQSLVVLGQAGTRLWEYIDDGSVGLDSRFDDTSRALATRFVDHHLGGAEWEVVFPGEAMLPLGRLSENVDWGLASPLGLTISDEYGLWMAHRIAFVVDASVHFVRRDVAAHPCDSCVDKPCVAACPVGAVDAVRGFDVETCGRFRFEDDSICAYQCLARSACPVGVTHQYGPEQMAYHYGSGLASIRRYYEAK